MNEITIKELEGKILKAITGKVGDEEMIFETKDGKKYRMYHHQNCCESVSVEDICGNLENLIGTPIIKATEDTNSETNPEGVKPEDQDSFTWTFYNISTIKGDVTIRWYGESNGYYSESVDFEEFKIKE